MEILNQNQRNRAKWRLVLIGIAVVVLLALSMCSSHNQYADKKPLKDCEAKVVQLQRSLDSQQKQFENETTAFKDTIADLRFNLSKPDQLDEFQKAQMTAKNDKIRELEREIDRKDARISSLESQVNNLNGKQQP